MRIFLILFLFPLASFGFKSPFPSECPGIDTPNCKKVDDGVYRSQAPEGIKENDIEQMQQWREQGIDSVLIFKIASKYRGFDEVEAEKGLLKSAKVGFTDADILDIPFRYYEFWRDGGFRGACEYIVDGLDFIEQKKIGWKESFISLHGGRRSYRGPIWALPYETPWSIT